LVTCGPQYVNAMHENRFLFDVFYTRKNAITRFSQLFIFDLRL